MSDFDFLTRGIEQAEELSKHTLYIGALKQVGESSIDFLQMIADVQETGRIIKPVHGRFLTIPTPLAGTHKAGDFDDLFFYKTKNTQHPTLARIEDNQVRVYFLLKTQVTIPARSFLGTTVESEAMAHAAEMMADGVTRLYTGELASWRSIMDDVGKYMARRVKDTIRAKSSPQNKTITKLNKGNDNPLIDTGSLLRSMSWVVV